MTTKFKIETLLNRAKWRLESTRGRRIWVLDTETGQLGVAFVREYTQVFKRMTLGDAWDILLTVPTEKINLESVLYVTQRARRTKKE